VIASSSVVTFVSENPTREKILFLLKKKGPLSIDDLSRQMGITPMGIRQHLISLERKGLVDYIARRYGVGRPAFLYKLTEKADDLFPKAYHKFILTTLKELEKNEGRDKVDEIFRWRKEKILKDKKEALSEKKSLQDRVFALKDVLESDGYLVDLDMDDNNFILKEFNCPIARVASEYREACKYELQVYRELLRKEVTRQECIAEGSPSCTYVIPKTPLRA
jgi:predicted ArsR family transcriptional regulator